MFPAAVPVLMNWKEPLLGDDRSMTKPSQALTDTTGRSPLSAMVTVALLGVVTR